MFWKAFQGFRKMANGKRISWKNYKETNIKDPSTFQERPCKKKKKKNSEQKVTFFKTLTFLKTTSFSRH